MRRKASAKKPSASLSENFDPRVPPFDKDTRGTRVWRWSKFFCRLASWPFAEASRGFLLTILVVILAFSAFLRLNQINDESLWLDEGVTYYNSSGDSYSDVWNNAAKLDQSPPFYYFIMHTYLQIFGENEFGFRLIPLIFGVLSVLFLYLLISEMLNMEAGLFAAFLLAINPFHIGFSIESRMYVLLSLEALIGFYSLYMAITSVDRGLRWWILFTLMCIFGLYTHNFFFFVLLAFFFIFFILLFSSKKKIGKFLIGILSAVLVTGAYIPWIPSFLKQMKVERYWMVQNSFSDLKNYFLAFSNDKPYFLIGLLSLCFLGFGWTFFRYKAKDYKKTVISIITLCVFIFIGFGVPLMYSLLSEPIMKIRYMVYILPIFLGIASFGIYAFRRLNAVFAVAVLLGALYILLPWHASAYPIERGEDFRRLTEIVKKDPSPIFVHTPSAAHVINFYNKDYFIIKPFPFSDDLTQYNINKDDKSKFRDLIRGNKDFYLVITHTHENPPGLLYIWSDEYCESNYQIDVYGMKVYRFTQCT